MGKLRPVDCRAKDFINDGVRAFALLDFDGVFNPFSRFPIDTGVEGFPMDGFFSHPNNEWEDILQRAKMHPGLVSKHEMSVYHATEYDIHHSSEMVARMNDVLAHEHVQPIWLSTWRAEVGNLAEILGIESAREQFYIPWHKDGFLNKVPAAREFLWDSAEFPSHVPVVWADDDMWKIPNPLFNVVPSRFQHLVTPMTNIGINREQMAGIETFLAEHLN